MLGKKTNSDGSIIFWYLEPGAKEKWQQIPLKGLQKTRYLPYLEPQIMQGKHKNKTKVF